jgi:sugar phosphate permease
LGFWLPTYLNSNNVPDVAWITAMTDVGSIPGGIVICLIGYYFDKRAIIIVPSLWIGTLMMISINFTSSMKHEVAGYMCLIFFTGLFIGGCYNNISSAITVELSN